LQNKPSLFWTKVRVGIIVITPVPIFLALFVSDIPKPIVLGFLVLILLISSLEVCPVCGQQVFRMNRKPFIPKLQYKTGQILKSLFLDDKLPCFDEEGHGPRDKFRYEQNK